MPTFDTPAPVDLYVEVGKGSVTLTAADVSTSTVQVAGPRADDVLIELDGSQLSIVAPKSRGGFLGGEVEVHVRVTVPTGSSLVTRTGSADVTAHGTWRRAQVKAGSGQVELGSIDGAGRVEAGSGDVHIGRLTDQVRIKSGSGDVGVEESAGVLAVSSGSGDVRVDLASGSVSLKTGSGDLRVGSAAADIDATTASGDVVLGVLSRGHLRARTASGDVTVGVAGGVPVWTDVSSVSGHVHSDLRGAGVPADGQEHIEIRVSTASGDVALQQR